MEPLNKKERTAFIIKFSASFVVGILIIMIPFYFLIQLPEFENEIMTKDYRNMQEQMKFQKEHFAVDIEMAKQISAKYDLPNQDIDRVNIDLVTLLSEMEKPYLNDTTWSGKMYRNIVKSYSDFKKAKNDVLQKDKEVKECKQNLEKAKADANKNKDTMGG